MAMSDKAILVIDMQNDFVLPDAPLCVKGAHATIGALRDFIAFGRAKGWHIIYVVRCHRPSGVDAEMFRRCYFSEGNPICVSDTKGAEVVEELAPVASDIIVVKHRFSAFFATDLDMILRNLGVKSLYVTGTQYPNCVRATAVDAMSYDYSTTVVTDCCSAQTEEIALANIRDMQNMGIPCIPSGEIICTE